MVVAGFWPVDGVAVVVGVATSASVVSATIC